MKKNLITYCLVLLVSLAASAQHQPLPRSGQFRIGLGYQRTWMLDKQASPLKYQSSEKTILLGYTRLTDKDLFNADIKAAIGDFFPTGYHNRKWYHPVYQPDGSIHHDSSLLKGTLYNSRISIGYARNVGRGLTTINGTNITTHRYAGASLNSQLFYTDNIVRTGWMHSASVNADFEHLTRIQSKHQLRVRLSIPLFARNTRLPYHNTVSSSDGKSNISTLFRQGSKWAWLGNFQNVRLDAGYEYAISHHARVGLQYSGQVLHYRKEAPVTLFQNNLALSLAIQ